MRFLMGLSLASYCSLAACTSANSNEGESSAAEGETGATQSGGETGGSEDGGSGDSGETGDEGGGPAVECGALEEGANTLTVDGETRQIILNLPTGVDSEGPWPVVFNWHGLGDSAANMSGLVASRVDGPAYRFIAVTPEDTNFQLEVPLLGVVEMDWDVFAVDADNRELALFDAVVACLDERYGVDADRVHTMGFSLGGIMSDLVASSRSEVIASVATYSGGYWNNPNSELGLVNTVVDWPAYEGTATYPQLFLHGGETDTFSLGPAAIQFNDYALADSAWLAGRGHPVFICDHGGGHTAPPAAMGPDALLRFFADHPRGAASPYAGALPETWPDDCAEVLP